MENLFPEYVEMNGIYKGETTDIIPGVKAWNVFDYVTKDIITWLLFHTEDSNPAYGLIIRALMRKHQVNKKAPGNSGAFSLLFVGLFNNQFPDEVIRSCCNWKEMETWFVSWQIKL
jgi:hypothetical protein